MTVEPEGGRVCLSCRHVLVTGACDQPGHQVIMLDAAGRERLATAMWGPRAERRLFVRARARRSQRTSLTGVVAGAAAAVSTALAIPSRPVVMLVGVAVGTFVAGITSQLQRRVERVAVGAGRRPPAPPFARGTIVAASGDDVRSPVSGLWCAAWALELTQIGPGPPVAVLRDAATTGLEIRLDGGALARVPAGPWHPHAGALVTLPDLDDLALRAHLLTIDPGHRGDDELAPLHHDAVHEALLHVGDRVELCGEWQPILDDRVASDPVLYRDAPATVLVPTGWPTLRRV